MKVLVISQARTGSTRLPNKIFKKVNNKSLLEYHLNRLKVTGFNICIATTTNKKDDAIEKFCLETKTKCFRGSEEDVLSRFYHAANFFDADTIVRVTSDCPLIDPWLICEGLKLYKTGDNETYVSNIIERTYPRGFDFEIFSINQLKDAFLNATSQSDREHVTPYIYKNSAKTKFLHLKNIENKADFRITVDTEEDFLLIKILIKKFECEKLNYSSIIKVLESNPELVKINSHIEQKKV